MDIDRLTIGADDALTVRQLGGLNGAELRSNLSNRLCMEMGNHAATDDSESDCRHFQPP